MKVTTIDRTCGTRARVVLAGVLAVAVLLAAPLPAMAQDDPNPGALTFTGGLDFPTIYFFRGIRQETDPKLTMWPFGDLGIALFSGDGGLKSVGVNVGVWNSLHTGTSGSDGPGRVHYELDFYSTLALGFGGGVSVGTTYMAFTSPNGLFDTVNELSFKVSKAHMLAPYGFIAFELDDEGQADLGSNKGTYLELGVSSELAARGEWTDARNPRQVRSGPQRLLRSAHGRQFRRAHREQRVRILRRRRPHHCSPQGHPQQIRRMEHSRRR